MAKVYLAEDVAATGLRRWSAVKIPDQKYRDATEYRRMFQTEAALATQISHPHVCAAFEAGDWNGTPFFAMEVLRGKSLLAVRKVVSPKENPRCHALRVARIIADACEGLQAIHDYGTDEPIPPRVVHRDISPDNLFLTMNGFVKIIDFGLAQTDLTEQESEPELLRGKISYIAPELLNRQVATCRSDVWGLGVVTWELLTGRPLFNEATDYETLVAVREQTIVAPSELVPGIPHQIDAIVRRALQREPSDRFETAAEFGAALWRFMISEQSVVQHVELADWLESLFPSNCDAFTCLSTIEFPGIMPDICTPAQQLVAESPIVVQSERMLKRQATISQVCVNAVAGIGRIWSRFSAVLVREVVRVAELVLSRLGGIVAELRVVPAEVTARLREQLLTNSNPGERRKNTK